MSGTAIPGSTVKVTFPDGTTATGTVDSTGHYSVTSPTPQGEGSVIVTDTFNGNTSAPTQIDYHVDVTPPAAPSVHVEAGIDGTVVVTGIAEANSTVTVTYPDGTTATTRADASGHYTLTSSGVEGSGTYTATATDEAGNTSAPGTFAYTDNTPPAAPTVTATPNADGSLTVSGKAEPGSKVTVTNPDGTSETATAGADGSYSVTTPANQPTGDVTVHATDAAGNTSPDTSVHYVDTIPPSATAAISGITTDTGVVGDFLTADSTLIVSATVTGTLNAGEKVQISLDGGVTWHDATLSSGNTYVYDNTANELPSGTYTFEARVIDASGNYSTPGIQKVVIDTSTMVALSIDSITQDTGASATDFITSDNTLVFNGSLGAPLAAGSTVQISLDGGATWHTASVSGTSWTYDNTANTMADGTYNVQARIVNVVGSTLQIAHQNVVIDTQPPSAAETVTIGSISVDTGVSASDFITSDNTLVFSGSLGTALAAGDGVRISLDGGLTWSMASASGKSWLFDNTSTPLADGTYTVIAQVIDQAGNIGQSATQAVVIKTSAIAPTVTPTANPDGTLTVSGTAEAGSKVTVTFPDGTSETATAGADGSYSMTTSTHQPTGDVTAHVTDAAGNTSPDASYHYTDTLPPSATAAISGITTDTGVVGDFITADSTLIVSATVTGTLNVGEKVQISLDGGVTWHDATLSSGNTYVYDNTANELPSGTYTFEARVINTSGNYSTPGIQKVVIDTSAMVALSIDSITEDTGVSATDFITSDSTLVFHGSLGTQLAAGSSVQISLDGGATWHTVSVSGTSWTYDNTANTMADGTYNVQARIVNAAGSTLQTAHQNVVVDTQPPSAAETVTIGSITVDTGVSSSDFITSDNTLVFSGSIGTALAAGDGVRISLDGGATWSMALAANKAWLFDNTSTPLADGTYTVIAQVIDQAGNIGQSATQIVVIKTSTVAPTVTPTANIDGTLTVTGTADAGSKVTVTWHDGSTTSATADASGHYTATSSTPQTPGTLSATASDVAGNVSTPTQATYSPDMPSAPSVDVTVNPDGSLTVSGKGEPGSKVTVTNPDGTTETTTAGADGSYSVTTPANQPSGNVSAHVTNPAGITGPDTTKPYVDTTPPAAPSVNVATNPDGSLTVSGKAEAGSKVTVTNPDGTSETTTAGADGSYSVRTPVNQPSGNVVAHATDAAGNTSPDTTVSYKDVTPPLAPSVNVATNPDGSLTVSGKAEAGSKVTVTNPDGTSETATAGADGSYSVTTPVNQPSGNVVAHATDAAGNTGPDTIVSYKDITPPAAPSVNVATNPDGSLTVSGKAEPGSKVTVTNPDGTSETTTAGADGSYSVTTPAHQPTGDVIAHATDAAGNTSPDTSVHYVDTIPPSATAAISGITTDTGVVGDFITADQTLIVSATVTGTLNRGEKVQISVDGGVTWHDATLSSGNTYVFDNTANVLPSGTYTFEARVINTSGLYSTPGIQKVVIDTSAMVALSIDSITEDTGVSATDFITSDSTLVFHGSLGTQLDAGSSVQISLDGGATWHTASVSGTSWTYDNTANKMADGTYDVQVKIVNAAGSTLQTAHQNVVIDTQPPSAAETVTIGAITVDTGVSSSDFITSDTTLVFSGSLGTALAAGDGVRISLDGGATWSMASASGKTWLFDNTSTSLAAGTYTVIAQVIDQAGNVGQSATQTVVIKTSTTAPTVSLTPNADGTLTASGAAESGSKVTVTWHDGSTTSATADASGHYTVTSSTPQTTGTLSATASDVAGNVSTPTQATYTDTTPPLAPSVNVATNPDGSLTVSGKAEAGSKVTVTNPDGTSETTTAGADGSYSVTTPVNQPSGNVVAHATDAAGNTGPDTTVSYKDITPPAAPSVNVVAGTGGTVVVSGAAEANSTVTVTYPDGATATVKADASGHYTLTSSGVEGSGTYTATATDAAGNKSAPGFGSYTDTTPPDAPTVTATSNTDGTVTVSGKAEAGSTVKVTYPDGTSSTTKAGADGSYSVVSPKPQGGGTVEATATDAAGNTSAPTDATFSAAAATFSSFTIDLTTASDNGVSSTDNITSVITPTFTGAVTGLKASDAALAAAGQLTVTLFDDRNNDGVFDAGDVVYAKGVTLTVNGTSATFSTTLPAMFDGTYNLKAVLVNSGGVASNVGLLDGNPNAHLVIDTAGTPSVGGSIVSNAGLGYSMSSLGDFNGDGYSDFVVSAPHDMIGGLAAWQSAIYVMYGGKNGLPSLADINTLTAAQGFKIVDTAATGIGGDNGVQGMSVIDVGDLNGDGYSDFAISSNLNDRVYVIFGRGGTGTTTIDLASIENGATTDGFVIKNVNTGAWLGTGVSGGDINGDGYSDLIIGSIDGGGNGNGQYTVLYGHAGAAGSSSWSDLLAYTDGLYTATGSTASTKGTLAANQSTVNTTATGTGDSDLGNTSIVIGDVNGDGYNDYIVTAPRANTTTGGTSSGAAYLIFGSANGLGTNFDLKNLTPSQGIQISGTQVNEWLGGSSINGGGTGAQGNSYYAQNQSVQNIGDINGDGIDDFAIGSPYWNSSGNGGQTNGQGRVYVVYGKAAGNTWSNLDLSTLNGTNGFTLYSSSNTSTTNNQMGFSISSAGDVNGDGIDDFLIGAPGADSYGKIDSGAVYLVYGTPGGTNFSALTDIDKLVANGQAVKYNGVNASDYTGTGVAVGDWNGDGISDYAYGAWGSDVSSTNGGSYTVYSGSIAKLTQTFTTGDDVLYAGKTSPGAAPIVNGVDIISGGAGNDIIHGIGTDTTGTTSLSVQHDVALGGAGNDTIGIVGTNFTRVDGGLGIDTLAFEGKGMTLDLAAYGKRVQGFEKFDLGQSGSNTLKLRLSDVLNEADSLTSTLHMTISGDSTSTVVLAEPLGASGWQQSGSQTVNGVTYDVWHNTTMGTNTMADLLIQHGVNVV
ncbi:Ig-like domain-containing protein [Paraburkholderia mimosarum]|uniref:Ig-like domain-containing protein n=1 Tax=Paraburkholderia mimosarum TaxID=312026 RepID=UPI00041CB6EF|nr:Ig-like domain-containing protein [Paraburkholderia mimosarum]